MLEWKQSRPYVKAALILFDYWDLVHDEFLPRVTKSRICL